MPCSGRELYHRHHLAQQRPLIEQPHAKADAPRDALRAAEVDVDAIARPLDVARGGEQLSRVVGRELHQQLPVDLWVAVVRRPVGLAVVALGKVARVHHGRDGEAGAVRAAEAAEDELGLVHLRLHNQLQRADALPPSSRSGAAEAVGVKTRRAPTVSKSAAADCAAQNAGFSPDESATGLIAADKLARTRDGGIAESAGELPPATLQSVAADQAPLSLLQFPIEVLLLVLGRLDMQSLAHVAATCSALFHEPMNPVEEALQQRAAARGRVCPARLPQDFSL